MIRFFFNTSPNPMKVALFLEESGLLYEPVKIDTRMGEQFAPDYVAFNPNSKVPAILDGEVAVFDSNAILLYLAEKTGKFLPAPGAAQRAQLLSWLMFVASGVGPYSGQAVHFAHFAPKDLDYALDRYLFEARRHYELLDARLLEREYLLGDDYGIVDMAAWGWSRMVPFILGGEDAWKAFPNLKRWFDQINTRPAVERVNALQTHFTFKAEMDAQARGYLFRYIRTA